MKQKRVSVFLAILATFLLSVMVMAQEPAPATAPASEPASQSTDPYGEMPATASPLALLALLGAGSIGAGAAAHRFGKR